MRVSDFVVNGATKIKMLLAAKGMNMKGLAELLNTSQPNLSNKMKRENFSEKELQEIAEALGAKIEINFVLEDGTKI
ncbi:MAG: XRE family transcriptional regulator [Niallia sp.]